MFKPDIVPFFNDFHRNERLSKGVTSSFVTLVPKKECPKGLTDFRPISLIGSIYKILSKVLANRFKQVAPKVVSVA